MCNQDRYDDLMYKYAKLIGVITLIRDRALSMNFKSIVRMCDEALS